MNTTLGTKATEGLKPSALMALALKGSPAEETQVLEFAPKGPHAFAVKRLQILAELCQQTASANPPRPIRQLLGLVAFELANVAVELQLEDETTLIAGAN